MKRLLSVVGVGLVTATFALVHAAPPQYSLQGSVNLTPFNPQLTAVDPYANATSSADGLKPARPFWYSVDSLGLTILRTYDNVVVYRIPWPATIDVVEPNGEFVNVPAPPAGWEPVGITVSYPTEEQLASNSETPDTYVYVVMAHSGFEWRSNPNPPTGQDLHVRDTFVTATSDATEASMLVQIDVTDPSYSALPPSLAGAILGHGAGQPAFDPATGNVYIGNMPSTSLPSTPVDLTSFVSVIAPLAPPAAEAAGGELPGAPEAPMVVICGPEHPDQGVLAGVPVAWACTESGDGPSSWEFSGLPTWLIAHPDKRTGQLDGILYGTPVVGSYTFQARVTDYAEEETGLASEWATYTLNVTTTAPSEEPEGGFEAGIPSPQAITGTGSCAPMPTISAGSLVPNWVDVATVPNGCVVMGTAPISGESYEFALPDFHFAYPFDHDPVIFSGSVAGAYVFDPLPAGVGISGLAWHEIDKLHDPSTEADVLNAEFIGVDPFTGQMYRILPPQGVIEGSSAAVAPPETSIEGDEVSTLGEPLATVLGSRSGISIALTSHPNLKIRFGDVVVEASRNPNIYVSAAQIVDPTGADATVIPIGGPAGSAIENGAIVKVSATRDGTDPTVIAVSAISTIDVPGVQAYSLALDSNLSPAIRGQESGQVDYGDLWVTGRTTGNAAVIDTALGTVSQTHTIENAAVLGGVSMDVGMRSAYVAAPGLLSVSIFGTGAAQGPRAPVIWGLSPGVGLEITFSEGVAGSYTIFTTGWPTPTITLTGTLPFGLSYVDNGNGTATISGTPPPGTGADYTLSVTAANGVPPDNTQPVILTVQAQPQITSANTTTFYVGAPGSFTVTTIGGPTPTFTCPPAPPENPGEPPAACPDSPPAWATFTDNGDGTGTLTGTPPAESEGTYLFTIIATTDVPPDATQGFTLVVAPGTPAAPAITLHPANVAVMEGQVAIFRVSATGYPAATVQWQASTDGVAWADISGATSTIYTTAGATMAMNGTAYRAVFANSLGTATSSVATLTVNAMGSTPPFITLQPANQPISAGQVATFTAAASGNPIPTVQWQLSTNGGATFSNIAGATSTSYVTPATTMAMNGYRYRAVFTNSIGTITSATATLTVNLPGTMPVVMTHPQSLSVPVGQGATFTSTATGDPAPTPQWQVSVDNSTWTNISGAASTSYTTPATTIAMNGYRYRAIFTNSVGTAYSSTAILTVYVPDVAPAITSVNSATFTVGAVGSFVVTATGTPTPAISASGALPGGVTFVNNGNGTATLSGNATTPGTYSLTISATNRVGSATQTFTLTVNAQATVPLDITTPSLPNGVVNQPYSAQLGAQGGTKPYVWILPTRQGLPPGLYLSPSGAISGTPTRAGTYNFRVQVTDALSQSVSERVVLLIVRPPRP